MSNAAGASAQFNWFHLCARLIKSEFALTTECDNFESRTQILRGVDRKRYVQNYMIFLRFHLVECTKCEQYGVVSSLDDDKMRGAAKTLCFYVRYNSCLFRCSVQCAAVWCCRTRHTYPTNTSTRTRTDEWVWDVDVSMRTDVSLRIAMFDGWWMCVLNASVARMAFIDATISRNRNIFAVLHMSHMIAVSLC